MKDRIPSTAHFVGVCGAGMRALAEVFADENWLLSGSDLTSPNQGIKTLIDRGLAFHQGHDPINVPQTADCLIYSPAIPCDNPERIEAARRQLPQFSYSQMVGKLMFYASGVCIAGTHGKSTTTAMTACILERANRLSGVVIGAELCETGRSGWSGSGDLFVAESCEYQKSYLDYAPKYAAILNIEPDHFDCYPNLASLQASFCEFASKTASDGVLLVNADCPAALEVSEAANTNAKRVTYGTSARSDWKATRIEQSASGTRFRLVHWTGLITQIELSIFRPHNVMNALAAAAFCREIGVSAEIIRESLSKFRGIRRRLQFVGQWKGATLVDDYAHHPTAVKITLETLRSIFKECTIRCVFQPHQVLRTTTLMSEFAASFMSVDQVLIAPVFAARETVNREPNSVSAELAEHISLLGVPARFCESLDQIATTLEDATRPGDVIVTMGAGDIDRIYHEFTRRI